jgi:hypothetical protein
MHQEMIAIADEGHRSLIEIDMKTIGLSARLVLGRW